MVVRPVGAELIEQEERIVNRASSLPASHRGLTLTPGGRDLSPGPEDRREVGGGERPLKGTLIDLRGSTATVTPDGVRSQIEGDMMPTATPF